MQKAVARPVGQARRRVVTRNRSAAKLWSPDDAVTCTISSVTLLGEGRPDRRGQSYFGMRKISLGKDDNGITRIMLNNKFLFQYGPLDQGFWPDGLYTAPDRRGPEVRHRGHQAARLQHGPQARQGRAGPLVLPLRQARPPGLAGHAQRRQVHRRHAIPTSRALPRVAPSSSRPSGRNIIERTSTATRRSSCGCRSTKAGASSTRRASSISRERLDPTRLVNSASGWTDRGVGDVHDIHVYPGPGSPQPEEKRAAVLGEFGGLGLPLEGHTWQAKGNWGYRSYTDREDA